jgi:hypothetical protein
MPGLDSKCGTRVDNEPPVPFDSSASKSGPGLMPGSDRANERSE